MNYLVRIALALFDHLGAGSESLKGDLLEELENGRSSWWLWRQVVGAAGRHPPSVGSVSMLALGTALLMLLCFEAVVVTNGATGNIGNTMRAGVFAQFLTMVCFVVGLFLGSRVHANRFATIRTV